MSISRSLTSAKLPHNFSKLGGVPPTATISCHSVFYPDLLFIPERSQQMDRILYTKDAIPSSLTNILIIKSIMSSFMQYIGSFIRDYLLFKSIHIRFRQYSGPFLKDFFLKPTFFTLSLVILLLIRYDVSGKDTF